MVISNFVILIGSIEKKKIVYLILPDGFQEAPCI